MNKRGMSLMACVVLAMAPWAGIAHAGARPVTGASLQQVPVVSRQHVLKTLDGKALTLESLQGEVVVVNFWASWCAPCRRELPVLNALQAEIASKGGRVLAVSIDDQLDNVRHFVRANKLTLPIAQDGPDGLARQLDLDHVPFTMILDRTGEVAFTSSGSGNDDLKRIATVARQLVAKSPHLSQAAPGGTP